MLDPGLTTQNDARTIVDRGFRSRSLCGRYRGRVRNRQRWTRRVLRASPSTPPNTTTAAPEVTEALSGFCTSNTSWPVDNALWLSIRLSVPASKKEHIEAQNHHLAALGVALLDGLIWTIYDAASDRSIVVNAFQVSATLDSGGHTGAALASTFLDALDRLRSSNGHGGAKRALVGALDPQVQVEIPEMHPRP